MADLAVRFGLGCGDREVDRVEVIGLEDIALVEFVVSDCVDAGGGGESGLRDRIGRPAVSTVKENGETWEVEGLYVADSSVFATTLGVIPMVTVLAIAYYTRISVLDRLRRKKLGSEF